MKMPFILSRIVVVACASVCLCGAVLSAEPSSGGPEGADQPVKTPDNAPVPAAEANRELPAAPETPGNGEPAPPVPAEAKPEPAKEEKINGLAVEDDAVAEESEKSEAGKRPVGTEPVQVFGYMEWVKIGELPGRMRARCDTGARTSSLHVESEEEFERDGAKWVRFVVLAPENPKVKRVRISAPLVRWTRIKVPGGGMGRRRVVRLNMEIGGRKLRTEFSLNNRNNMLCPVLIGRRALKDLGLVDASRIDLADKKIFR